MFGYRAAIIAAFAFGAAMTTSALAQEDPYLWLEEVMGDRAISWVKEQNAKSQKLLEASPQFAAIRSKSLEVLNSRARIPAVVKRGDWYYNFWQDEKNVRGLWRRTTLQEYRKAEPKWEPVLDLDQLSRDEKENWVWKGSSCLYPNYDRCLLTLSRGGADAAVVREFDIAAKAFVAGGFQLKEAKGSAAWIDRNTLFVQTDFGPGSSTKSGYPRIVKEWKRGTPLESAKTVFEGKEADISVSAFQNEQKGYTTRQFVRRAVTFFTAEMFLREGDRLTRLDVPLDAQASYAQDMLWVRLKSAWTAGDRSYAQGSLIAINFERFMKGERNFDVLFEPTSRKSLAGWTLTKNYLILNELDNVKNRLHEVQYKNGKWNRRAITMPGLGTVGATAIDSDESDDYFLTVTDYLTPSTLFLARAGGDTREQLKSLPAFFDASPYRVEQFDVASRDGERIPFFVVMNKNTKFDGRNPTLLYGYGGFEVSQLPGYSATVGNAWLNNGGVYVVANIRGGGEYGEEWHLAGNLTKKQNVFDDFAACAEHLIQRGYTRADKLAVEGGSNGGLLMGAFLTQHPQLARAVVAHVGLYDMLRVELDPNGAFNVTEFGTVKDPAQFRALHAYSPFHQVKNGTPYPAVFFLAGETDGRVNPAHSRRMTAALQSATNFGNPVLARFSSASGHGMGTALSEKIAQKADVLAFLFDQLGMTSK